MIGLFSSLIKIIFYKKYNQFSDKTKIIIYNIHKASFGLCVVVSFIHGLTYVALNQTYILTGWLFGIAMIALMAIGIKMGFKNDWKPYTKEQNAQHKGIRGLKWILTILSIVLLGMHYLL